MYYYIVDPGRFDGKSFEFYQTQLLSLLGEYHVTGEVARITKLRTVDDLVATAVSHGVTTLVIAGGDETFDEVISVCHGKPLTLGFIPINSQSGLGKILGISNLLEAVVTIAKRRVEILDLARVGPKYFFSSVDFSAIAKKSARLSGQAETVPFSSKLSRLWRSEALAVQMRLDGAFTVSGRLFAGSIINTRNRPSQLSGAVVGNPRDGLLDVVLAGSLNKVQAWRHRQTIADKCYEILPGASVVHAKEVEIIGPAGLELESAGKNIAIAPTKIWMTDQKIRLIVGKDRTF